MSKSAAKDMARRLVANMPNTVTCLNLVSGVMACVAAGRGVEPMWGMQGWQWAMAFIGMAAVFDYCDGLTARLLRAYSALGKELDSLCDCVSFGVAPALLVLYTMEEAGAGWPRYLAILIAVAGALRLARFNIDDKQATSFIGLPIPANAIFWIGAVSWIHTHGYPSNAAMMVLIGLLSWLMVSPLHMFSLKIKNFSWRENFRRYVLGAGCAAFVATEGLSGLAWTVLLYVLISLFGRRANPE